RLFSGIKKSRPVSRAAWALLRAVGAGQAALFEQRLDLRLMAGEIAEQLHRIDTTAARQQGRAEVVAVLAAEATVLAEPLLGVGVQHFRPDVGVVAGRVA